MTTQNIISTPEITGNIGSCETKSTEALIYNGILTEKYQVIMTNSCTGQIVKDYQYDSYSGSFILIVICIMVLSFVAGVIISDDY